MVELLHLCKQRMSKKNLQSLFKKSESLQTEGRHFRSTICKINDV